jgi:cytochrome c oxidase cbb3-type subunit I/II
MVVAITCYGMSTLEGPLAEHQVPQRHQPLHGLDVAHVHVGGIGWNGFLTFGMIYWLVPRMFGTKLDSKKPRQRPLLDRHAGHRLLCHSALLRRLLPKPDVEAVHPGRLLGVQEFPGHGAADPSTRTGCVASAVCSILTGACSSWCTTWWKTVKPAASSSPTRMLKLLHWRRTTGESGGHWHRWIERRPIQMLVVSLVAGGHRWHHRDDPTFLIESNVPTISSVKPYTPLELARP